MAIMRDLFSICPALFGFEILQRIFYGLIVPDSREQIHEIILAILHIARLKVKIDQITNPTK